MGIRNWQNIPFCIEALMKIAPERLLDIGVGFGQWGILTRAFCDVRHGRILPSEWKIHMEGLESDASNIAPYHHIFYNKIHVGDFYTIVHDLENHWDVVIFDETLEYIHKDEAICLLKWALEQSDYVLLNISLGTIWEQNEISDFPYEHHISYWEAEEFQQFYLRRSAKFLDYINRPFGSFVLSRQDPMDLSQRLFSENTSQDIIFGYVPSEDLASKATHELEAEINSLQRELRGIYSRRGYRILNRLQNSRLASPLRRILDIAVPIQKKLPNHPPSHDQQRQAYPGKQILADNPDSTTDTIQEHKAPFKSTKISFSAEDRAWLEQTEKTYQPVSVLHPSWRGIRASTRQLFDLTYELDDTLNEETGKYYAHLFLESGCSAVVIQGFPVSYLHLLQALHKEKPNFPIFIIWHGSFTQARLDYDWQRFVAMEKLCREGIIYKIGFVKHGMAEIMARQGLRTGFIMNMVQQIPQTSSQPLPDGPHLGIWNIQENWLKPPYAMLAASSQISEAKVHISGAENRVKEFSQFMKVPIKLRATAIPQEQMGKYLAQMDLNLYVTLSECAPMLPLESLAVGAPCLFGPTSHYFKDNSYLYSRLVVPAPDDAFMIANYIHQALEERDQIIDAYREYAPGYNERARAALRDFLEVEKG